MFLLNGVVLPLTIAQEGANNIATIYLADLEEGHYDILVKYIGDGYYTIKFRHSGMYLDVAKNDEERVEILNQRVDYIMQNDDKKAYSEQALEDVIAIDGILKTVSSAAQVANTADDLGNTDVLKKYEKIADERSEAEGDNLDDQANG